MPFVSITFPDFDPAALGLARFRVWPDGTVQAVEDGEPYRHMSDDFRVVWARNEDDAPNAVFKAS